ncbi:oxidoreductase [Klebsormidium nitens]|uniref:Oxidoreductase n=1 Tax=Klebsormidium nitens TaxID=105231 RepID=A0A1Y1IQF5_KLENI|nr:oxidoreductase [Klebsormidium nitens]|eukprot:GAQ93145.1 oxidoreductase [Klebsormidium nitens]
MARDPSPQGQSLRAVDLFTGIGGVCMGLKGLVHPILHCEIFEPCQAVLRARMKDGTIPECPIVGDVHELSFSESGQSEKDNVQIMLSSWPCTGLSSLGKRLGFQDEKSKLFFQVMRLIDETHTPAVFFENVPNVLTLVMNDVVRELTELRGFTVPRSAPARKKTTRRLVDLGRESWVLHDALPDTLTWDYDALWNTHPPEFGKLVMFDRVVSTPRWQQAYMRPYYFTGTLHEAPPLPPCFQSFLDWANGTEHGPYNSALVNWYKDGTHYIGPHRDSDRQLVGGSTIMSITLGATRTFRIRDYSTKDVVQDLELVDGSFVVMGVVVTASCLTLYNMCLNPQSLISPLQQLLGYPVTDDMAHTLMNVAVTSVGAYHAYDGARVVKTLTGDLSERREVLRRLDALRASNTKKKAYEKLLARRKNRGLEA